jgi:hypothetical protein
MNVGEEREITSRSTFFIKILETAKIIAHQRNFGLY